MERLSVLDEPQLEFAYSQRVSRPHDGLFMFGPYDAFLPSHPASLSYAVIGTPDALEKLEHFFKALRSPVDDRPDKPMLWPAFPGFEAAFGAHLPDRPTAQVPLDMDTLSQACVQADPYKRVTDTVNQYLNAIGIVANRDDHVGVIVCIVPDMIFLNCRPESRVGSPIGTRPTRKEMAERRKGQLDLFEVYDPEQYQFSRDFRRQIKARAMEFGIPIQIIRESTLRSESAVFGQRTLTPLSDRAWKLGVALYYKAGGKPWRLAGARPGVCYVGLAYKRMPDSASPRTACCAAQVFLDSGDGIVFMGKPGPWYSPEERQFHLTRESASALMSGVLKTYEQLEGQPLTEIFLHCRSDIGEDEFAGFAEACPTNIKLTGIRVRREPRVRLYREGQWPVLRGTFWPVSLREGYLWAHGFKPSLRTYDGLEIPVPLKITVQHGDADLLMVASDILGLTKLNYNSCILGDAEPVTIRFSDAVGEILVSNPTVKNPSHKFKFYI